MTDSPAPRTLLVLDDDPTGSQCVSGVQAAFDTDPRIALDALRDAGSTCFVLTNTRSMNEADAVRLTGQIVAEVLDGHEKPASVHVVSRSDSTLRGHVIAEVNAIADVLDARGMPVNGFLLCPAMIEAGRVTENDIHYARVGDTVKPVAHTDFAKDATFGYSHSHLPDFLEERSGGSVKASEVVSIPLSLIRERGVHEVAKVLSGVRDRTWVVVNATQYSDMEIVAQALAQVEERGHRFVTRCGPSFVRPLAGQQGATVIDSASVSIDPTRSGHGVVVVGSHVGLTSEQLAVVRESAEHDEYELDVPSLLNPATRDAHLAQVADAITARLPHTDCVVYTSRTLVSTESKTESLDIARHVSNAVVDLVRLVRTARPSWIVAKGGITSHEVAASGLEIRRAIVQGQFYPGQISLFTPIDAPDDVLDVPYVVFPGNVGTPDALADVVSRLREATKNAAV